MISFIAGGGAAETGASFYVLRLGDTFIGIDCGFRPNVDENDPDYMEKLLPDFRVCPRIDYLFVTHGHLDHTGAAPCLIKKYEDVKIFMTEETQAIGMLQWQETIKIGERTQRPTPFNQHELGIFLSRIRSIAVNEEIDFGEFSVKTIPAGHILGAVSLIFTYQGKKIFVSGDISFQNQETIEGARHGLLALEGLRADFLISEATYAGEEKENRLKEKVRFLNDVKRIAAGRGQILIPSFSIGRAQEMFEMLRKSDIYGHVPIYIDGMAKQISDLYKSFLPGKIYPRIEKHYVLDRFQRYKIFEQRPCVVIASSGMLNGGTSVAYAQKWMYRLNNGILFPGYLDPCSPGSSVLTSPMNGRIALKDRRNQTFHYTRRCEVQKYHFSAHADGQELLGMQQTLNPRLTILVHGEPNGMRKMIEEHGGERPIFAPKNGQEIVLR